MRDAAVAAINVSLSLMKGLIRQQISRLLFKCQAPHSARCQWKKGTPCQTKRDYLEPEPKEAFMGSAWCHIIRVLYCCRTRETLNQLLFDDFLSAAFTVCCSRSTAPPQSQAPSPSSLVWWELPSSCQNPSKWSKWKAWLSADIWKSHGECCLPLE